MERVSRYAQISPKEREIKIAEYNNILENNANADREEYGVVGMVSNEDELQKTLYLIGYCRAEVIVAFSDVMSDGFLDYKREIVKSSLSGINAINLLFDALEHKFKVSLQKKQPYGADHCVEYAEKAGKKLIHLRATFGNPLALTETVDLYIREI